MNDREFKRLPPKKDKDTAVINRAVSGKLRAYYDTIASQEVPDRFKDLLNQLDESDQK